MKHLIYIPALFLILSCSSESKEGKVEKPTSDSMTFAEKIAVAHGINQWDEVKEVHFTFNVDIGEKHIERSWVWNPKDDLVTLHTDSTSTTYKRTEVDDSTKSVDAKFVNDVYWLTAPYKLVWDEGVTFSEPEKALAPILQDSLTMLSVSYEGDNGYTPGDGYDFFVDEDHIVREWIYHKGDTTTATMNTTWEGYEDINGLKISTMHKNADGSFQLYFTDLSVIKR